MGIHNSQIKARCLGVVRNLLGDIADLIEDSAPLCADIGLNFRRDLSRDYKTIFARTTTEGIHFLTITLPRLGKWYDEILSTEDHIPISLPLGFKPYRETPFGTCPLLARTLMFVLHSSAPVAHRARVIRAFRSLFFLFYKLEMSLTQAQQDAALTKWENHELKIRDFSYPEYYDSDLIAIRDDVENVMKDAEWIFHKIHPRHGPGAVAGGETGDEKWETMTRIDSLHRVFGWYDLYYPFSLRDGSTLNTERVEQLILLRKNRARQEVATSRLLFVPKDSRGPRTISCEPVGLMFVQQGVARNMMKLIYERTAHHVNFEDQNVNGQLALASSLSGYHATVDLEDASDSVTLRLVQLLLPEWSLKYWTALRSECTLLPNGDVVTHQKYAPMGSAICFPMESLIFWAIAVRACINAGIEPATAYAETYIYGDDIIIPSSGVSSLKKLMARLGLTVNASKSYASGPFRESCGVDAYRGTDVTPLRIKKVPYLQSHDGNLATTLCELSSRCFSVDYRQTGEYLASLVEERLGEIPRTRSPIGCLHITDPLALPLGTAHRVQWDSGLCKPTIRAWVVLRPQKRSSLAGVSRLLKNLYGFWEMHDPAMVADLRAAKIRKRNVAVEVEMI